MYEIEPVATNYMSYMKGFAGISSLLSVYKFIVYNIEYNRGTDALLILIPLLIIALCFLPSYLIFVKLMKGHDYLKKGLKLMKKITKADIE
jgi:hypothetical protein